MKDVVTAIFELMGNCTEPLLEDGAVQTRVDRVFQVWCLFIFTIHTIIPIIRTQQSDRNYANESPNYRYCL